MPEFHQEECIKCGTLQEFQSADELQAAILNGDIGEYICRKCLKVQE